MHLLPSPIPQLSLPAEKTGRMQHFVTLCNAFHFTLPHSPTPNQRNPAHPAPIPVRAAPLSVRSSPPPMLLSRLTLLLFPPIPPPALPAPPALLRAPAGFTRFPLAPGARTLYLDPTLGADTNDGQTPTHPLKTIEAAKKLLR